MAECAVPVWAVRRNRLGYRWTTILALILMNATIFISFFVSLHLHVRHPVEHIG
jgi:hypothetical protein